MNPLLIVESSSGSVGFKERGNYGGEVKSLLGLVMAF